MHQNLQRLPAERVRHRKRLPFQGWPDAAPAARQNKRDFTLTGPTVITQIIPINTNTVNTNTATSSTTTPVVPPINTSSSPSVTPSLPSDTNTPSPPAAPPIASPPGAIQSPPPPVASAIPPKSTGTEGAQNGPVSAVTQPHGLPTGAVVGITIACVMLILGAFIFFIRQRAVRNRKLRRATAQWMNPPRPMNGSFEPVSYPSGPSGNMSETSAGASFARAQAQALSAPPPAPVPVPTMPAPVPSSYNNPVPAAVPAGGAPATVRYEFIPSLPDELSITTGEVVRMLSEYDDGWALCRNGRGEQGMVPLECLDRGSPAQGLQAEQQQDARNSRRTSSLGVRY